MSLTAYERESIINFNEEEKTANIYTHNKRMIKRLEDSCKKFPDIFQLEKIDGEAYSFTVPKKYISIRTPKIMSDEQKRNAGERMKQYRANMSSFGVDNNTKLEDEIAG